MAEEQRINTVRHLLDKRSGRAALLVKNNRSVVWSPPSGRHRTEVLEQVPSFQGLKSSFLALSLKQPLKQFFVVHSRSPYPSNSGAESETELDRLLAASREHPRPQGLDLSVERLNDLLHVGIGVVVGTLIAQLGNYPDRSDCVTGPTLSQFDEFSSLSRAPKSAPVFGAFSSISQTPVSLNSLMVG